MPKKQIDTGLSALKQAIRTKNLAPLYIFSGEESYLKMYYLNACKELIVGDGTFAEFNLFEFDAKTMSPDQFRDAIESYPVMAERKIVIVHDFDLYKMPTTFQDVLPNILSDLPDYICLIFHYDILELKPDKRLKIHQLLSKVAQFVQFEHLEERQLIDWIRRRFHAQNCSIDDDTIRYLIFMCGSSMTNLITEIEKACAFCSTGMVKQYHIDSVCTKVLDAVIFDLSDAITERNFEKAVSLVGELLAQKNPEVVVFSTIARHMQRLYAAKLNELARGSEKELLTLIGSHSPYYARRIRSAALRLPKDWLRESVLLCGRTDAALKGSTADKQKLIEFALLEMASGLEHS